MSIRRVLPYALIMLISSCSEPTASIQNDILFTTTVSKSTFRAGDEVLVTVSALNRGKRSLSIADLTCTGPFDVLNSTLDEVGPPYVACGDVALTAVVQPGQTNTQSHTWKGASRLNVNLPPGRYTLDTVWHGYVESVPAVVEILN